MSKLIFPVTVFFTVLVGFLFFTQKTEKLEESNMVEVLDTTHHALLNFVDDTLSTLKEVRNDSVFIEAPIAVKDKSPSSKQVAKPRTPIKIKKKSKQADEFAKLAKAIIATRESTAPINNDISVPEERDLDGETINQIRVLNTQIAGVEKNLEYLDKMKSYYHEIHNYRIKNRFYRALTYTDVDKRDFKINFDRSGKLNQNLIVDVDLSIEPNEVSSYLSNASSTIVSCILKALNDYFIVSLGEGKAVKALENLLTESHISLKYPGKFKRPEVLYDGVFGTILRYGKGEKRTFNLELPLAPDEFAFLIAYETWDKLRQTTDLYERASTIKVVEGNNSEFEISIEIIFYNLFSSEYKKLRNDSISAERQSLVLLDSILLLKEQKTKLQNH